MQARNLSAASMNVLTKAGAERVWEIGESNTRWNLGPPVTYDEIVAKFDRVCEFTLVPARSANGRALDTVARRARRRGRHRQSRAAGWPEPL
jgi:hypothetical protein